ncbi:hypothetical protein SAMN02745244_00466 [Tessaracoccus bendigoensis DSM 12906]|uniref:TrwC relaxase n=1 Tax=Tessaracoccus bendigoensis DSM 12906 TaxID=1123357 RepID=A0A1M6BKK4_9ACTN|nr:hypothetical protein [Tessaracoccus bendigoensis]SHI49259.1 hypothetical protein SAMN02745244_00466 [Tessaracoccus bendigoensis DSM 12906]
MLATAITASSERGKLSRVVTPTKKAADVAQHELGTPTASVAALVHAHGWRWNRDGVWTRLTPGDTDPETGRTYTGVPKASQLAPGEWVDLIQTRKNDTSLGLANRQLWIVQHVTDHGALWAVEAGSGRKREHTVSLPAAYVTEHTHLAYASTAYGVQGVTAPGSHTILSDAMSGAAVYVGMTRGKQEDQLHIIAENTADARQQFIDAVERDRADRGRTHATQQAAEAVWGLVDDGPVKIVNTEIAALTAQAEHAERRAALWEQAADTLAELREPQRYERDHAAGASDAATQQLERVRGEVAAPLTEQASAALAEWQAADTAQRAARDRLRTVGRFGKRRATKAHRTAQTLAHDAEQRLTSAWGEPPRWNEDNAAWVERVTRPRIDADPRVTEATVQQEPGSRAIAGRIDSSVVTYI